MPRLGIWEVLGSPSVFSPQVCPFMSGLYRFRPPYRTCGPPAVWCLRDRFPLDKDRRRYLRYLTSILCHPSADRTLFARVFLPLTFINAHIAFVGGLIRLQSSLLVTSS